VVLVLVVTRRVVYVYMYVQRAINAANANNLKLDAASPILSQRRHRENLMYSLKRPASLKWVYNSYSSVLLLESLYLPAADSVIVDSWPGHRERRRESRSGGGKWRGYWHGSLCLCLRGRTGPASSSS